MTVDIDGAFVFDSFEHRVDYDEGACPSDTGTTYQPNTAHHIMYHTPVLRPFSGTTRVGRYSPWPHFSNNGLQFYCQNVVPKYVLTFKYFRPALCFIFVYNCGLTVRNKRICYVMLCRLSSAR